MKKLTLLFALIALVAASLFGQTNPRAWYAQGQVWVVWTADTNNPPETYAIYSSAAPFTNTADAALVGRLFEPEWNADNLKSQMRAAFGSPAVPTGYRVPQAGGGYYTLIEEEGIFVETVRTSGSKYYAVLPWGENSVTSSNLTTNAVSFLFDLSDPPRPQLQARGASTGTGHTVSMFILFVDGDQDLNAGRSDFPIFANHHKRGSPHLFLAIEPLGGLPGSGPWPATMCLHGANGDAIAWLPNNDTARAINVAPTDGYVIAFDDELYSLLNTNAFPNHTRWIGYVPSFDAFENIVVTATNSTEDSLTGDFSAYNPPANETIVNYTQRRILWILDWLIANGNVDSNHVSLLGFSNGSMGAQSFARAYPDRISSLQLFNCGMRYYISQILAARMGDSTLNLPVTLTNHLGQPVHLLDLLYFTNRIAVARDLPFTRHFHGKCDHNGAMLWRGDMVDQIRLCDREGWGMHFYWDLREHGMNEWRDFWVDATTPLTRANQTQRDDVRNQSRYRANQSYPAFFNLQLYANHRDPGPGHLGSTNVGADCISTNGCNGDDYGTWGGYFDWVPDTLVDTPTNWQCSLFLVNTNSGYAAVDACPFPALTCDLAIRRPQQFLPVQGSFVRWEVRHIPTGNLLADGTNTVGAESLVSVPDLIIPRDPNRVRLIVSTILAPPYPGTNGYVCGDTDVPGNYVSYMARPGQTDSRITGKNNPQYAFLSTNAPQRNQLVIFFPGTGGVPASFQNFCQNAANLGFHALALTYDNDTSLQDYCGNDPDADCHYKVRYEVITGIDTTTKANITRANSIEFRLAAFLNYLHTNNPAHGWGQFLVATNTFWTNALAWDRFFLAGHSQGSDYAAFIAKHYEVQRVAMFAGGDFWFPGLQPANWMFLPSATPPDRWFYYGHRYDMSPFELSQLEAIGLTQFAPPVDTYGQLPPYAFSHTLTSTMEPCPNIHNEIEYHGATVNDPPQVRDTNGVPLNAEVWSHMLLGPTVPPTPANLIADSILDFSDVQGTQNWRYGFYNRTSDPNGIYNVADFRPLPTFSNTLYATPAWVLSNDLQVAVWLTGARPHGANTNACCTNRAAGPELWPVRRWVSPAAGPLSIAGTLAKWDLAGGDGVTGMIKLNGVTVWNAFVGGTNIFGTNYSVAVNVPLGSFIDFLIVPGADADHDGARFTAQITAGPTPPPYVPTLYIAALTNDQFQLWWYGSSNYSYYIEQSVTLTNWSPAGWPIPAPVADGWLTNILSVATNNLFFRLRADVLTNSPVPTAAGIYSLQASQDGLARTYRLNIPAAYNPAVPAPLAFMLHGGGQTANEIADMHPALAHHANTNGMILVIPQSTHNQRNTGWSNEDPVPGEPYVDDVSFILGLIDRLDASLNIDRSRVYSAGFSSGGIMTHYLASRTTNVFAAVAACGSSVGGERRMSGVITTNPPPSGPIPALIINGTNDCTRPYHGGYNTDGNYQLPAIYAAYHYTDANLCAGAPVVTTNTFMTQNIFRFEACDSKPPPGVLQPNQVIRHHWPACSPNTEVVFYTLTDGGHLWPDANDNVGFDANLAVIEFFKRH